MDILDTYSYNSVDVAKAIIAFAHKKCIGINMTKTQKLLYICYGTCLAVKGERLTNEHPQAWPYGPVFPTTRNKLLKENLDDITISSLDDVPEINRLLEIVFNAFGSSNATALSEWTHQIGSPWYRTTQMPNFKWGNTIPDEYIKEYFDTIIIRNG